MKFGDIEPPPITEMTKERNLYRVKNSSQNETEQALGGLLVQVSTKSLMGEAKMTMF